jgi:hypothetical protein
MERQSNGRRRCPFGEDDGLPMTALQRRLRKLESVFTRHQSRIAIRFEDSEIPSTPEADLDEHTKVITVRFISAKDGRPANPEDSMHA